MSELQSMVDAFHKALGQQDPEVPRDLTPGERMLRARLIAEEATELVHALVGRDGAYNLYREMHDKVTESRWRRPVGTVAGDLAEIADGCADLMVVATGTLCTAGIFDEPLLDEVMKANMAKLGGGKDAHGKFMKPAGWAPPDVEGVLKRQGWKGDAR